MSITPIIINDYDESSQNQHMRFILESPWGERKSVCVPTNVQLSALFPYIADLFLVDSRSLVLYKGENQISGESTFIDAGLQDGDIINFRPIFKELNTDLTFDDISMSLLELKKELVSISQNACDFLKILLENNPDLATESKAEFVKLFSEEKPKIKTLTKILSKDL